MSTTELERASWQRPGRRATDGWPRAERDLTRRAPEPRRPAAGVAVLFPGLRPCDDVSGSRAQRRSWELQPDASFTAWIVSQGLDVLGPAARHRIIDAWRAHRSPSGGSIVVDEGCDVDVGAVGVGSRARSALLAWLPLAPDELAVYEGGLFRHAPAAALTLLVRPPTIWSVEDALTASADVGSGHPFEPGRFAALERYADEHVRCDHVERLRAAVLRIERRLPASGFPIASRTIAEGCATLRDDDGWCAALAARQLARYASSLLVRREGRGRLTVEPRQWPRERPETAVSRARAMIVSS